MINTLVYKSLMDGYMYKEFSGLSTDTKPVYDGLATGSLFHEVDTTKVYAYNAEGNPGEEWVEQIQLGGSNSGSDSVQSLSMSPSLSPSLFTPDVVNPEIESIEPVEDGEDR